jgi:hypothetical protein
MSLSEIEAPVQYRGRYVHAVTVEHHGQRETVRIMGKTREAATAYLVQTGWFVNSARTIQYPQH